MLLLLAILIALIVHGTLYPWQFVWGQAEVVPTGQFILTDAVLNVVLYIPLGVAAALAIPRDRALKLRLIAPTLIGFALSFSLESLQQFQPARHSSAIDVWLNVAGTAVGAVAAVALAGHVPASRRTFLLLSLVAYQLFPLLPGAPSAQTFWSPSISGMAGAAALWLALELPVPRALTPLRSRIAPVLMILVLALRGLLPASGEPVDFSWMPFAGALGDDWRHGLLSMLEKTVYYGTAIWTLSRSLVSLPVATVSVAALLGVIEGLQTALPGRIPEITDPILALIAGVVLAVLPDQSSK